eukprot:TRINITY_DN33867_c0_g1_i1.p1 TRINITY_DN33867_c0_g1~~TRINITY_DN33867_c0_g1_i1.p1  ORF type:complete len:402 (-),score=49.75 TRINITY_DN33867_c0_g1_i1:49-1254(-)
MSIHGSMPFPGNQNREDRFFDAHGALGSPPHSQGSNTLALGGYHLEMNPKEWADNHSEVSADTEAFGREGTHYMELDYSGQKEQEPSNLGEDVYAMLVAGLVHDVVALSLGTKRKVARVLRLTFMLVACVLCNCIQYFVLMVVRDRFGAPSVHRIQRLYQQYESVMYAGHTIQESGGQLRGTRGFFSEAQFAEFDESEKNRICAISLSNPRFLSCILFLWTVTCMREVVAIFRITRRLLVLTPTVKSTDLVLNATAGGESVVAGLTIWLKVMIAVLAILPRWVVTLILLWLGCRWLTAMLNLEELLLNGLALEFIVLLKDSLYYALVTQRNRELTENTLYAPPLTAAHLDDLTQWGLASLIFLTGCVAWVLSYIYFFQSVLPDYKWDVRNTCHHWMQTRGI